MTAAKILRAQLDVPDIHKPRFYFNNVLINALLKIINLLELSRNLSRKELLRTVIFSISNACLAVSFVLFEFKQ